MALDISWLNEGLPIFAFVLTFVLAYAIIAKTKILGENKAINAIISLIIGIIFLTFTGVREFLINITPWFAVLLTILFFFFLIIGFMIKSDDWSKYTKPTTIVFIILLGIILIGALFYTFPSSQALLPEFISGENHCDYKIDYDDYHYTDCYKKGDDWKCYSNSDREDYEWYDSCYRINSRYKCYDYDNYEYSDCYNSQNYNDDIFSNMHNWIYREKITNAFWLIVITAIAIFAITRK